MAPACRLSIGTILTALLCTFLWSTTEVTAQSITSGELNGRVVDSAGQPVFQARVVAASVTSGWEHVVLTPRDGEFEFTQVPPGEYELLVEIIGYGPVRVVDIPIRPGQDLHVPVTITLAAPPVLSIDTVSLATGLTGIVTPGSGRWLSGEAINDYPDRLRTISSLAALTSRFDPSLGSEGLPASMTQTVVDGVSFVPARHPWLPGGGTEALILPRSGLAYVAFPETQTDIEWQGGAGGYTVVGTRSGEQRNTADFFGGGSAEQLWSSDAFDGSVPRATTTFWGGARASIPLVRDTTRLFVAAEAYQVETPRVPILPVSTESALPGLDGRAAELGTPWIETTRSVSGIARVDWTLSPTSSLQVGAVVAALEVADGLAMRSPATYGTSPPVEALDVLVSGTLTTHLFAATDLELRASFQRSSRDYPGADSEPIPGTRLVGSGGWIGLDPSLPMRVTRTSFVGGPTLHFSLGRHNIKAGGHFSLPSFEYESPDLGVGSYVFPTTGGIAAGNGTFEQIAGSRPVGSFSLPRVSSFLQYAWDAAPGLRLTSGLRYDAEILPDEDVRVNADWISASGLRTDSLDPTLSKFSARIGLHWNLTGRGNTVFVAGAGTHHGDLDPGAISEVLSFGGGVDVRRSVGGVGSWPSLPDETTVPVTGERITLMSPRVRSPRTRRAHVGLWQLLGETTVLRVSGSVRRTDFLLRRTDLNLVTAASGLDQFRRPVLGQLIQQGGMLAPAVGSNRRFSEFDQVWALNPDGWSEQAAVTVSLDHRANDWLQLFGSYTWSETEDNWLGLASGQPNAALDPGLDDLRPKPWSEGTSDLDIPHRAAAGFSVRLPVVTLTGTYRFRSAYAFTAGYRAGVDANGDGSALNDVAFVPDDDDAVVDLARNWDCLATAVGRFAKRNSCRGEALHSLDLRLALALYRSNRRRVEVVVEGFNLLESEFGLRDTALLLVDGSQQLSVDPTSGAVNVPLTVNPDFGKILTSTSEGRLLRIGFRIGGDVR